MSQEQLGFTSANNYIEELRAELSDAIASGDEDYVYQLQQELWASLPDELVQS